MSQSSPTAEASRLLDLETTIETGLETCERTFFEIGVALTEIRDGRLYKATHSSFDAYCLARWGFTKSYAETLIRAAVIVKQLSRETSGPLPANASQVRALATLLPSNRVRAWEAALEAAEGKQPSSRAIAEPFKPGAISSPARRPSSRHHVAPSDPGEANANVLQTSLDADPRSELGRMLGIAQDALLESRSLLSAIKAAAAHDGRITAALTQIGALRFDLNSGAL